MRWQVAMRPGKRKKLDKATSPIDALMDKIEKCKASIRAKVEHPFRVIKRQFGYVKVRYRGLKKHAAAQNAVCAVQPVDGPAPVDESTGLSASKSCQTARNRATMWKDGPEKSASKASSLI